jgi:hypothetical protein
MTDLFDNNDAIFSDDRKYRYRLTRIWDLSLPLIAFIGLNPSTANEESDDPTIRRLKGFVRKWDYGGFFMYNLFALVTPYPQDLLKSDDPIGRNDEYLKLLQGKCPVVFAWGSFKEAEKRAPKVIKLFPMAYCLGKNANGSPKHPLYLPSETELIFYS